jgi:hypothetical protein
MKPVEISVVCAIGDDVGDLSRVHAEFRQAIARTGRHAEFLYVLDGRNTGAESSLRRIEEDYYPVRVFRLAKGFGLATALEIGFENAAGRYILTIPERLQASAEAVPEMLSLLDQGKEVVVTRREPRCDAMLNRVQSRMFHWLLRRLARSRWSDLTCDLRAMTREAALKLELYGDQHRFIPILAARAGFDVVEIPVAQHPENRALRLRSPGVYTRRLLDILTIYFVTRFTRKPLRFFGLLGVGAGIPGFLICVVLTFQRLFGETAIRERPLLLLGVLLIVVGVQLVSLGLLGEMIIFMSVKREAPMATETRLSESEGRPEARPETQVSW